MDKYQVLFLLIAYYLTLTITTAVFASGTLDIMTEQSNTAWEVLNLIFGGLVLNIPLVPAGIRAVVSAPFWIVLGYFIYLNIPKIAGSGSPQP